MKDSWKTYFLDIAKAVSVKSKDPSSKVGSLIVDQDNRIVSQGYNGFPAGCDETKLTYERPQKYLSIIHSEMNSLIYARRDLKGCIMICTDAPCENCLKHTLQAGIREVYYGKPDIMRDRSSADQKEAIKRLIEATGAVVQNIETGKTILEEIITDDGK